MSDKELIWVSKELADKYKQYEDPLQQEKLVKELINRKNIDIEQENEQLQESMLVFKSVCLAHKNALNKVYEAQNEELYKMWEEMGDISSKIRANSNKLAAELSPISDEVNKITNQVNNLKKSLDDLNIYGAENVILLADTISHLDKGSKDILKFMVTNYKRNQQ